MQLLYNLGIRLYRIAISIASLFNPKAKKWVNGRRNWKSQLPAIDPEKKVYWFHCASLGEFDQGLPLMELLKKNDSDSFILITFFSPSGMEFHHKREHPGDHVMYLPLDTPSNAESFLAHFNPYCAFFIKYEFWLNFIFAAHARGVNIYNVSGIFRPNQRFFKASGKLFAKALQLFKHFYVQNESSKELLASIGIMQSTVAGDCRFDRVVLNKMKVTTDPILEKFKDDKTLFIVGSSWPVDEKIVIPFLNSTTIKSIIAPHNVDQNSIKRLTDLLPEASLYSNGLCEELKESKILILDTIGHLSNAYSYGNVAYVGGGFTGKLHNILEPAVFGLPVLFGPNHKRFPEAEFFKIEGIGFDVQSSEDIDHITQEILSNYQSISEKTTSFVNKNIGASDLIFKDINSNLKPV